MSTTQAQTTTPTGVWQVDHVHSRIGFEVGHTNATFRGEFRDYDITYSADDAGAPRLAGTAKVASIDVRDENLEAHLLSPEFFDAERNPEVAFEATSIANDAGELVVEGDLTIKGTTRQVEGRGSFGDPSPYLDGSERIGISLETTVNRHEYGLEWNADLPDGSKALGDDVTIDVHLELVKEAE